MTIPHVKAVAAAVCVASLPSLGHAAEQDTVVVTATGFEQKIQDAPASISVITKQQIEEIKQKQRVSGFNSIFAVSSVDAAKLYYAEFQRQMAENPQNRAFRPILRRREQ